MSKRMTDERLAEIQRGIKENWAFDLVELCLELIGALKAEREEVRRLNGDIEGLSAACDSLECGVYDLLDRA